MESFLSLGRLHIPLYGLFAAFGLMAALALGLRTSVLARIDREAFWNLGIVSVIAAFLLSRLVLIVENLHTFLQFPAAVLELPSVTMTGLLLTAVVACLYVRLRGIPLLGLLDALGPCLAVLWVFLSLGLWAEGTREGMPTSVPWAVGSSFGRVHPVELYAAFAWALTCIAMMYALRRGPVRGAPAGWHLMLAGFTFAVVDFFRLPNVLYGDQMLDGIQWRGIEMMVAGGLLLAWRLARPEPAAATANELPHAV